MATPYIYERQSEYWTSRQIEEFFLDIGYEIITIPIPQIHEFYLPADYIYFDKLNSKIFGFQYKALYKNGQDHWHFDERQHKFLSNHPWIYYCLSELKDHRDFREALHFALIVRTNFEYKENILSGGDETIKLYSRWGAFYQGLVQCWSGQKINSVDDLSSILNKNGDTEIPYRLKSLLIDIYINDFDTRKSIHISPFLQETGG